MHLGTPFKGLGKTCPWLRERLVRAGFQAFNSLVDLARESDFLLLAGDVLEWDYPHLRAQLELSRGLKTLSREGVRVFIVAGNHDPFPLWKDVALPKGVHLFSPQGEVEEMNLEGGKVGVSGISHGKKAVRENLVTSLIPGDGDLRVALVHAYLQGQEGHDPYAPCSLGDMMSRDFHYWALGHIHAREVVMEDPWVVYPGNIQGRHAGEKGLKGCYKGIWRGDALEVEFCPLSPVIWETRTLEVEGMGDTEELLELLEDLKGDVRWEGGTLLRVYLSGASPLYTLDEEAWGELEEILNEGENRDDFVWVNIEERLIQPLDMEDLMKREEFLACLIGEAEGLRESMDKLLDEGDLSLLWGRREMIRWFGRLAHQEKEELVEKAIKRALAMMLEGR